MMQMECRSSRRGTQGYLLHPAFENRPGIVRARARFGMELHGASALAREVEPFDRAVVQRDVCRLARIGRFDREAVVLRGDEHVSGRALEHGMVRAAVAERKLVR